MKSNFFVKKKCFFVLVIVHLVTQPSPWLPCENRTQTCAKLGKCCDVMSIE